jgi:hypothetical protein
MTATDKPGLAASLAVTTLALLLQQPAFAEDAPATDVTAATSAVQPATPPATPAQHPAQAALAALEERRAARMADLDKRYEELRARAANHGFEMPSAPPWMEGPQWLSFDEMQKLMKAQGVELVPPPSPASTPTPPPVPAPPAGAVDAEEQMRVFDTIGKMTPEQQQACFMLSRWHGPRMPRRMPPAFSQPRIPQYPPGYAPRYGQPYRGLLRPQ